MLTIFGYDRTAATSWRQSAVFHEHRLGDNVTYYSRPGQVGTREHLVRWLRRIHELRLPFYRPADEATREYRLFAKVFKTVKILREESWKDVVREVMQNEIGALVQANVLTLQECVIKVRWAVRVFEDGGRAARVALGGIRGKVPSRAKVRLYRWLRWCTMPMSICL